MPKKWITIRQKFDFTVDEGKEWLNLSREKNKGHAPQKDGKIMCDLPHV